MDQFLLALYVYCRYELVVTISSLATTGHQMTDDSLLPVNVVNLTADNTDNSDNTDRTDNTDRDDPECNRRHKYTAAGS